MERAKVGYIIGNTVQGFNFEVLEVLPTEYKVRNTNTGEIKTVHHESMYDGFEMRFLIAKSKSFYK